MAISSSAGLGNVESVDSPARAEQAIGRLRLARFVSAGSPRLGSVLDDGRTIDLNRAFAALLAERGDLRPQQTADYLVPPSLADFLAAGPSALASAREALSHVLSGAAAEGSINAPGTVKLLPAADDRAKIICAGRNYREHVHEADVDEPELPILFLRLPATLLADGEAIVRPHVSTMLDWEGELAVVIGRRCRYVAEGDALDVIGGYTIFNDATLRDYQRRTPQWTAGKNFVATGPLGPYVIPSDDVPDPHDLDLEVRLNGEVMQQATTAQMIFRIGTLIAAASEFTQLEPGDIIATGTPGGVGFARKPPRFLCPGDRITVTIGGIGELSNGVVDEEPGGTAGS